MSTYTDSYGPVLDTGTAVQPTRRANTEIEFHLPSEVDSGTKVAVTTSTKGGVPHRDSGCPR